METPIPQNLSRKPLAEAIFEYHWALRPGGPGGQPHDPGFRLLVGRFYDQIRAQYPAVVDLPAAQAPDYMLPRTVRHQFRPSREGWPIVQLGPGLITTNATRDYVWPDFRSRALDAIGHLRTAYPEGFGELEPAGVVLRYINRLDPVVDQGLLAFLREKLHVSVGIDNVVFPSQEQGDRPVGLNLTIFYPLDQAVGNIGMTIATGQVNGESALIWQFEARSSRDAVSHALTPVDDVEEWLDKAHQNIERWFFGLAQGSLLEGYK